MATSRVTRVREIEHCWIPVSGGIRLSARLWLPEAPAGEPTPALLEYIPYRKRDMVRVRDERNHAFFGRHGYACVRVDMRGSGDSEGLMTDMYRPEELDDALEVIDWIAARPWCNGTVGMMGTSWGGTASLQAAARRPAALGAIIAVCATDNRFDDDIHHMGGCLLTDSVEWGATLPAILALPPDPETVGDEWRRIWRERLEGAAFPLENWIRHETRDAYWRHGSVNEAPRDIACPALLVGGWSDRYNSTVMNLLAANREQCWGIVGPWGHHYPDLGSPGPGMGFQQEALRWWDHWLKGVDNGIDEEPRLRVWMQGYAPPRDRLERRPGRWVGEREWPSPVVEERDFRLGHGAPLRPPPGTSSETALVPPHPGVGAAGREPRPMEPGKVRSVSIDFPNTAYRFDVGHRIRLALSCAYWPLVWPMPRPARIVLHLAEARLVLPIRSVPVDEAQVAFPEPAGVAGPKTRAVVPARPLVRQVESEGDDGVCSSGWHLPYRCTHFNEIDLDFGVETRAEFSLEVDEPENASARFEHRMHVARDGWTVDVTGIVELRSTVDAYHPTGSLEVRENGELVFERRWNPVIPRTCS